MIKIIKEDKENATMFSDAGKAVEFRKKQIRQQLDILTDVVNNKLDLYDSSNPSINWGNVGDLGRILRIINDAVEEIK